MKRLMIVVLLMLIIGSISTAALLLFLPTPIYPLGKLFLLNTNVSPSPSPRPVPTPILTAAGTPPSVSATATYLLDADTNHVLDDTQGETPLPMASTTKIMTAMLALRSAKLNQLVPIGQDAFNEVHQREGSSANLRVGDYIPLQDLLYGLLLPSGDDAAIAIADAIGGTTAHFVDMMNLLAHQLHLTHTHYINPDGLTAYLSPGQPNTNHYTTAADLVQLAHDAMQTPLFTHIVQTQRYTLAASGIHHAYTWQTTDILLTTYPGMAGIKTGYTLEAGYCFVFAATRTDPRIQADHHLIGVVLHSTTSETRFRDATTLLDWGFELPLLLPL